jgi:hypothetical protein
MTSFNFPFEFTEDINNPIKGNLQFDDPIEYTHSIGAKGFYRSAKLVVKGSPPLDLLFYSNPASSRFIYLGDQLIDKSLLQIIGLEENLIEKNSKRILPGQLFLGSQRTSIIGDAMHHLFGAHPFSSVLARYDQSNLAVFPIAREGLKYQVAEALNSSYGFYCDEIVLDAHHVFDSSVPVYNRTVELTLFKDKDLDKQQKENIKVAFLADSIASGLVMKEVIARVSERFENLERIEVVAPLATIRGLCRLAQAETARHIHVRVHVFETILNALPPDYYYSAHYKNPGFHIRPELETAYRNWWGKDKEGNEIAETACAGYGWSEVFYSPRKQIQMMNSQLTARHGLTIADIVKRNLLTD